MVQPFRDLLWRCSAHKLAKYAFKNNAFIVPLNSPSRDPNVALGLYTTVLFIL
jgi:hypothetical protein